MKVGLRKVARRERGKKRRGKERGKKVFAFREAHVWPALVR